jgi:hypothetical protein
MGEPRPPEMDSDEIARRFEEHIAPLRDSLERLVDLSDSITDRWGHMPSADSPAMAELAAEREFSGPEPWGDQPVQATYNIAGLQIVSATDCARSVITLLRGDRTPTFSHVVLARACLEQLGRASQLLEPGIGIRARVARGVNERIFGLAEQRRLPLEDPARPEHRRKALLGVGKSLDFAVVRMPRGLLLLHEERPGLTELLRRTFELPHDRSLGDAIYGMYAAVSHGTSFGLSDSVDARHPDIPFRPGVTMGAVVTSSIQVVSVLCAITIGWGQAINRRMELFGWQSPEWAEAWLGALRVAKQSLPPPDQS